MEHVAPAPPGGSSWGQGRPLNVHSDFFLGGMAKNSGPNPMSFPKNNYLLPSRIANFRPGYLVVIVSILVIILRTRTKVCGYQPLSCFFQPFHLLTELYPLVPFPPSAGKQEAVYTSRAPAWGPVTSARAQSWSASLKCKDLVFRLIVLILSR